MSFHKITAATARNLNGNKKKETTKSGKKVLSKELSQQKAVLYHVMKYDIPRKILSVPNCV
mgnify:FL=1